MLRIRSIHYDAFKSSKLARLSAEAERTWWRIQCLCDDDGRAEDDVEVICGVVFPKRRDFTPEDVDAWLEELHEVGLITRYEVDGRRFFAVAQWHEYQHPRRPQTSKIPAPPRSVPVATPTDNDGQRPRQDMSRHVAQEGSGEGGERSGTGGKGESEGEPEAALPALRSVDNLTNPAALTLAARAATATERLHCGHQGASA